MDCSLWCLSIPLGILVYLAFRPFFDAIGDEIAKIIDKNLEPGPETYIIKKELLQEIVVGSRRTLNLSTAPQVGNIIVLGSADKNLTIEVEVVGVVKIKDPDGDPDLFSVKFTFI